MVVLRGEDDPAFWVLILVFVIVAVIVPWPFRLCSVDSNGNNARG